MFNNNRRKTPDESQFKFKLLGFAAFLSFVLYLSASALMASDSVSEAIQSKASRKNYKALMIGIGEYRDKTIQGKKQSKTSAQELGRILERKYAFQVDYLINDQASRQAILEKLNQLIEASDENDNILLFYSGAGAYDKTGNYGWWFPCDAEHNNFLDIIDNDAIREAISKIKAGSVLLLSDAAFASSLTQTDGEISSKADEFDDSNVQKSRTLLFLNRESPYVTPRTLPYTYLAKELIDGLALFDKKVFSLKSLHSYLSSRSSSKNYPVKYASIVNAGHEGGDFVFSIAEKKHQAEKITEVETKREELEGQKTKLGKEQDQEKDKAIEGKLIVDTEPENTRIRILNIKPKYYSGIELNAGRYQIEVAAEGYQTYKKWISLDAGQEKKIHVALKKLIYGVDGKSFVNSLGMNFVYIPKGSFMMGSPPEEKGRNKDEIQRPVKIKSGFYIQTAEVTVRQWRTFVEATSYKTDAEKYGGAWIWNSLAWVQKEKAYWDSPYFEQTETHPVTCVSWNDANAFIEWLKKKEKINYRLPNETEWEYSCRAGTKTAFAFGNCLTTQQANFNGRKPIEGCSKGDYKNDTQPVKSYKPNSWKIYDMHGNVWEWCNDIYSSQPGVKIIRRQNKDYRVARGGAWDCEMRFCRSAFRVSFLPKLRFNNLGFRLVKTD